MPGWKIGGAIGSTIGVLAGGIWAYRATDGKFWPTAGGALLGDVAGGIVGAGVGLAVQSAFVKRDEREL